MKKTTISLAIVCGCFGHHTIAAEPSTTEPQAEQETIENITVYAQKRAQNTRDVSVAVSVLQSETLEQLNLKDTTQLSAQIPNVKITANTGEGAPPVVSVRGVGSVDYNNTTTAPVAFYVDNVVGGALSNSLLYLFDVERIEVLKGPQGSLFGRNTNGGAVLISSRKPVFNTEGYLTAGIANQNHHKLEGVYNTVVSDTTAVRMGFSQQDYDYSSNNLEPGFPQAGMRQNNFRFLLNHQADNIDVLFKLHAADWDGNVKPVRSKGFIADLATGELCSSELAGTTACTDNFGFNVGSNDFHDVRLDDNSPHTTERFGGSVEVNYQFSDTRSFTSITSYNQLDRLHTFNCDASPARLCDGDLGVDNQVFTQELRLNQSLGDHYLIAGLFYLDEDIKQDNEIDLFYDFRSFLTAGPAHFFYDNEVTAQSLGIYSQFDYKINDTFTLTAGARYTQEDIDDLRLNMAAFYYDYDDQQVFMNQQSAEQLAAPAQVLDNIGQSTIYGAELDVSYTPDDNWLLQAGVGYLPEANLEEFVNPLGDTIRDNRLPFSSRWNANGLANYQTMLGQGTLSFQLEFDYQSAFYFDQNQNPLAEQEAYTLWNGAITWELESWRFALWGKNLTDEEYSQIHFDMGPAFGLLQDLKGEARRYGVELSYLF